VTLIFLSTGKILIGDGSGVQTLTAPTTGDYAGILMWRPKQASCTNGFEMNGGATFKYDGILYFPGCRINMNNNAKLNTNAAFTLIIADTITMTGSAAINVHTNNAYGAALIAAPAVGGGEFGLIE
jgi:hypothetical protein